MPQKHVLRGVPPLANVVLAPLALDHAAQQHRRRGALRREPLPQRFNVHEDVFVDFEKEPAVVGLVAEKLQHRDGLEGQVGVAVDETLDDDVAVVGVLRCDVFGQRRVSGLSQQEEERRVVDGEESRVAPSGADRLSGAAA